MTTKNKLPALNSQDIRELKNRLHQVKPSVIIDHHGLTDDIVLKIDTALSDYELVKIRAQANIDINLSAISSKICSKVEAVLIQTMGYIITIYRKNALAEE